MELYKYTIAVCGVHVATVEGIQEPVTIPLVGLGD